MKSSYQRLQKKQVDGLSGYGENCIWNLGGLEITIHSCMSTYKYENLHYWGNTK